MFIGVSLLFDLYLPTRHPHGQDLDKLGARERPPHSCSLWTGQSNTTVGTLRPQSYWVTSSLVSDQSTKKVAHELWAHLPRSDRVVAKRSTLIVSTSST